MNGRKIILDTNILVLLSKRQINIGDVFFDDEAEYCLSVISRMEALGYAFESEDEAQIVKQMTDLLTTLYIDQTLADKVIEIRKQYRVKLPDAIICATALHYDAELITNDLKIPHINGLKRRQV